MSLHTCFVQTNCRVAQILLFSGPQQRSWLIHSWWCPNWKSIPMEALGQACNRALLTQRDSALPPAPSSLELIDRSANGTKPREPQVSCTALDCDGVQASIREVRRRVCDTSFFYLKTIKFIKHTQWFSKLNII